MGKILAKPLLLQGEIMHRRFSPRKNSFKYKSVYISFPISQIDKLKKTLFSIGKFNLFSLAPKNFGDGKSSNLTDWITHLLLENNINDIQDIVLVTHPKVLGYAFNPVSFWLCFDEKKQLLCVLSEVTNTCGQKHNYLCFKNNSQPIHSTDWLQAQKAFYVSPFLQIEGEYKFRFEYNDKGVNFFINYFVEDKLMLSTYLRCQFQEFTNTNLLVSFFKIPFFTLKTTLLIHYQALKLYSKSIKYTKCPPPLKNKLTIGIDEKKDF
jgi:DUF1365 family protein